MKIHLNSYFQNDDEIKATYGVPADVLESLSENMVRESDCRSADMTD